MGEVRTITTAPGRLILQDIAPDGRVLVVHELKRAEVYGRGPDAEEEISLSWRDYSFAADLSPDGRQVVLSESGEAGGPGYGVYLRGTDGSPAVRLGSGRPLALSPDGAWALTMPLDPPERFVLLPTGAGEERTLPLAPLVNGAVRGLVPGRRAAAPAGQRARAAAAPVRARAGPERRAPAHHPGGRGRRSPAA